MKFNKDRPEYFFIGIILGFGIPLGFVFLLIYIIELTGITQ
tara:strand:- start:680 stop:802 length:123 start_codon:yes stop_codon:yes gene_type:complete